MSETDLTHLHLTHWLQKREDWVGYCTTLQQRHTQVGDPARVVIMLRFPQAWTVHLVTELLEVLPHSRGRCLQSHRNPKENEYRYRWPPLQGALLYKFILPVGKFSRKHMKYSIYQRLFRIIMIPQKHMHTYIKCDKKALLI